MSDFSKEILRTNIIYQIRQFNNYAELRPLERANFVIDLLNELLVEANKAQTEWSVVMGSDQNPSNLESESV